MWKKKYNSLINPCKMLLLKVILALSVYQHYCVGKYIFSVDYAVGFEISEEDLEIIDDDFTADSDESQTKDDESRELSHEILIEDDESRELSHEILIEDDESRELSHEILIEDDESRELSHEILIEDDESRELSHEILIEDDESRELSHEILIEDVESPEVSHEILIEDDEFKADSHENYIIDDEYSSDSDENQNMTDEVYTVDSHENYITDNKLTTKPDENPTTDSELTTKPDENPTIDSELTTKPDENPTTDSELTTKPDENPTTGSELTTKPDENPTTGSGECPEGISRFSKKDLRTHVDEKFLLLGFDKKIIEQIVPEAKDINQKHSEDFDEFLNWFKSKPEHLKDVLQGLAAVRQRTVEPEAQRMAAILKDYPQLKQEIDSKLDKSNELNKKLNRCDNICKNNCEDQEPEPKHIFKRSITEEYLCTSLTELNIQVITKLNESFDGFLNKIKDNLRNTNQTFTETIKNIKTELKGGALKEFSLTMYDVLNLQKEYHSFVNEINSTEAKTLMYGVKQRKFEIDSKLLELEKLIEPYRSYCSNCHKGLFKRSVRQTKLNENENPKVSIVDKIIQEKYNETEKQLNENLEEIFKDLNGLINDPKTRETYLNDLKSKEKEIREVANKERLDLENLKSVASLETLKKLYELDSISKDMLKNIDEKITRLKNIIK